MEQMREARLSEAIALQIAELILSGEIKSETKLRQEELAEILQVSRIPVREALQLLETQGLVKRLATRHIVTANLEESHIREVYGLIAEIERQAVESILGTGKRRKRIWWQKEEIWLYIQGSLRRHKIHMCRHF